jgi:hypothetical protein
MFRYIEPAEDKPGYQLTNQGMAHATEITPLDELSSFSASQFEFERKRGRSDIQNVQGIHKYPLSDMLLPTIQTENFIYNAIVNSACDLASCLIPTIT